MLATFRLRAAKPLLRFGQPSRIEFTHLASTRAEKPLKRTRTMAVMMNDFFDHFLSEFPIPYRFFWYLIRKQTYASDKKLKCQVASLLSIPGPPTIYASD